MAPQRLPADTTTTTSAWDEAFYTFLIEKGARSGSRRTVEGYGRMLWPFFTGLERPPDRVTPANVLAWAHGIGRSGRPPAAATIGARLAYLSSYYRFLLRMDLVAANPCANVERPRLVPAPARGLSADEVRRLLAVVPEIVRGRRDRAILLALILTGRRREEVSTLHAGDLSLEEGVPYYAYRGKGGARGRRELPWPAFAAIRATVGDAGCELDAMDPAASLWQAGARPAGLRSGTFAARFHRYLAAAGLPSAGLHVLRHSAAKLRHEAGESIEAVSAFLDHRSLAVTTTYLRRLEGVADRAWPEVAAAIGA